MVNEHANPRKRFAVNTILSVASWFFPLGLAFIATPIVVRGLGNEQYGVFAIALGFVSYAFSSGIGRISAKYIPEFRSSGQPEKISEAVSATFWLTVAVGVLQAVGLALAAPYLVSDVLLVSPDSRKHVVFALYLASAGGFLLMTSYVFQFVLQGVHRFDSLALISSLSAVLLNIGTVVLVIYGFGVRTLLLWNAAVFGLVGGLYYLGSRRALPELAFTLNISGATFNSIVRYASSIVIYQALVSVLFIFERTWIVRHFGTETLTFYVIPLMLAFYMHGFISSIVQVLFPVVNELINDRERLIDLYKKATKVVLIAIVFIVATYICTGRSFLHLWINPEFADHSYYLLVILSVSTGLNALGLVVWQLAEAFKHPGLNVLSVVLWLSISIPLMVLATDRWHSEGVAIARLIGVLQTIPMILYIEKRFLGCVFWRFWFGILFRAGIAALLMIFVESKIIGRFGSAWLSLFGAVSVGGIIFAAALLLVRYFSKEELLLAKNMLSRRTSVKSA
ncbi:MAG: oligosaccharide flippase family protein [Pyrinomonadaceae bacterium]